MGNILELTKRESVKRRTTKRKTTKRRTTKRRIAKRRTTKRRIAKRRTTKRYKKSHKKSHKKRNSLMLGGMTPMFASKGGLSSLRSERCGFRKSRKPKLIEERGRWGMGMTEKPSEYYYTTIAGLVALGYTQEQIGPAAAAAIDGKIDSKEFRAYLEMKLI